MSEKKAVVTQVRSRYRKAARKEKSAILDEFIKITGYKNRKYALRILNKPQNPQALLVVKGKTVTLKPLKKKPPTGTASSNRKTARSSASISAMTALKGKSYKPVLPPSTAPWYPS